MLCKRLMQREESGEELRQKKPYHLNGFRGILGISYFHRSDVQTREHGSFSNQTSMIH